MVAGRLTVSVEVAADVESVTVCGLNEQAAPAGGLEQLSVTLSLNPPVTFTVTL